MNDCQFGLGLFCLLFFVFVLKGIAYGVRNKLVEGLSDEGLERTLDHRGQGVPEVEFQLGKGPLARLLGVLGVLEVHLVSVARVATELDHALLNAIKKEK